MELETQVKLSGRLGYSSSNSEVLNDLESLFAKTNKFIVSLTHSIASSSKASRV